MKKIFSLVFISAIVFNALPDKAYGLIKFGPRVGHYKVKDADEGKFLFGAGARLKLAGIGVEGSIEYRSEKYDDGALSVRSWPVMVSGLVYPLPIVYGLAGVGWHNSTFDYNQSLPGFGLLKDETKQQMGYHIGAGVEIPLIGTGTTLTGDIRYVFLDYDLKNFPGGDVSSNFYAITVSLLMGL